MHVGTEAVTSRQRGHQVTVTVLLETYTYTGTDGVIFPTRA